LDGGLDLGKAEILQDSVDWMDVLDVEILGLWIIVQRQLRPRALEIVPDISVAAGDPFFFVIDIIRGLFREELVPDLIPDPGEGKGFGLGRLKVVKDAAQQKKDESGPEEVLELPLHHHPDDPDKAEKKQDENDVLEERNLHLFPLSLGAL